MIAARNPAAVWLSTLPIVVVSWAELGPAHSESWGHLREAGAQIWGALKAAEVEDQAGTTGGPS